MINRAYIEVMTEGDAKGRVFTFPIPTYNITPDFPWESENATLAVRDDGQVRPAVFPELHQLRAQAQHGALDVLPPAARPARAAQARQRPVRQRRADRLASAWSPSTARVWATCTAATRPRLFAALDRLLEIGKHSLEIKRKVIQRHMDAGPVPLHQALPRHAAQPLLHAGRERHQRDGPQLHRRRSTTSPAPGATPSRCACSTTCAQRIVALPGRDRPPVQPGGDAGRRHHLPLRARGPQALARDPAGRHRGAARTTPTRRSCRSASPTIRSRRWRARRRCSRSTPAARCCTCTWASACPAAEACRTLVQRALTQLPPALHHRHADVLDLPDARLPGRRARVLPEVRRGAPRAQARR